MAATKCVAATNRAGANAVLRATTVIAFAASLNACMSVDAVRFSDASGPSAGRSPLRPGDVLIVDRGEGPDLRLDVRSVDGGGITGVDRRSGLEVRVDASTDARVHRRRVSVAKTLLLAGGLAFGVHAYAQAKAATMLFPTP